MLAPMRRLLGQQRTTNNNTFSYEFAHQVEHSVLFFINRGEAVTVIITLLY